MLHRVENRLLNAREAAAYLGVSLYTLKKIEHSGYLEPYRTPGGHRRYSKQMLDEYLEKSKEFCYKRMNA
jgi:excisionase family DNA binding protein